MTGSTSISPRPLCPLKQCGRATTDPGDKKIRARAMEPRKRARDDHVDGAGGGDAEQLPTTTDWEHKAKQALADLVVARDALAKLKSMLSSRIRMDSFGEKLHRAQQEGEELRRQLAARDARVDALGAELAARDLALRPARVVAVLQSAGVGAEVAAAASALLLGPPRVALLFPDDEREHDAAERRVYAHARVRPAPVVRVVGADAVHVDSPCVRVVALLGGVDAPELVSGTLLVPVLDGVAKFGDIKVWSIAFFFLESQGRLTGCTVRQDLCGTWRP